MTVLNQFWQRSDKSVVVDKIKKTLTIPSFGSLSCGKEHGSIFFDFGSYSLAVAPTFSKASLNAITSTLTAEIWFKPLRSGGNFNVPALLNFNKISDGTQVFCLQLSDIASDPANDGKIVTFITNSGGTAYTITSATNLVRWDQWQCLTVTFDSVNLLLCLYMNGVLLGSCATTGTITGVNKLCCLGGNAGFGTSPGNSYFLGYIGDLRIWNQVLTAEEVLQRYNKPRGLDGIIDPNLVLYYRFTELAGVTLNNALTALIPATLTPPYQTWSTTEKAPIIFGASFIVASYHVSLLQDFSFRFPVSKPTTDCNFELHISWIDRHGTFQRRKFWAVTGVDIAPEVAIYAGERIESAFTLEIFNIDGNATVDLSSDLVLNTSSKTLPTTSKDVTPISAGSVGTIDRTLAEPFPLSSFPLEFGSQQTY